MKQARYSTDCPNCGMKLQKYDPKLKHKLCWDAKGRLACQHTLIVEFECPYCEWRKEVKTIYPLHTFCDKIKEYKRRKQVRKEMAKKIIQ